MTRKNSKRRVSVLLLALFFAASQSLFSSTHASDISGVVGNGGIFNINPEHAQNGIGFRDYQNFTLDKGDIANLIFKYGAENISKFVNLVDNQININGIVNSVRDGAFYNGEAVFVSPKGMVVGPSGVLNVGSLSILTPTEQGMNLLRRGDATIEQLALHGNSDVTINGKILSRGDVNMVARALALGADSVVLGGVAGQNTLINTHDAADQLFSSLVNTGSSGNAANMDIRTYRADGGFTAAGTLKNLGTGDVIITNRGDNGMSIVNTAKISNANGNLHLVNAKGNMNVNGTVESNGNSLYLTNSPTAGKLTVGADAHINGNAGTRIYNRSASGASIKGEINNKGKGLAITNDAGTLDIAGVINNTNANMNITSRGSGLNMPGTINSSGEIIISNKGANGTSVGGSINNTGNTYITEVTGDLKIDGHITNKNGELVLAGNGTGVNVGSKAEISNNDRLVLVNTGDKGLTMSGKITNAGGTAITNRAGDFTLSGTVENTSGKINLTNTGNSLKLTGNVVGGGDEVLIQNTGAGGFNMTAANVSNTGKTYLQNTNGAMNVNGTVTGSDILYIGNTGAGGLTIAGENTSINGNNNGKVQIFNNGKGGMNISSKVAGKDNATVAITNRNGNMTISNAVSTEAANMNLTNTGSSMTIAEGAIVGTGGKELIVQNTGANGLNINGIISNKGTATIYNKTGNLNVNGAVSNENGTLYVSNAGNALNINEGSRISGNGSNSNVNILNTGAGGMNVNGAVANAGRTLITNKNGNLNLNGSVDNSTGLISVNNLGAGALNIGSTGSVTNTDNNSIAINNSGNGGMKMDGMITNAGQTLITNKAGDLNLNGTVQNTAGRISINNLGNGSLNVGTTGSVTNTGNNSIAINNSGNGGMKMDGMITNAGQTLVTNKAGDLNLNGTVQNTAGRISINNSGNGSLNVGTTGSVTNTGNDRIYITNTGDGGMNVNGTVDADGHVLLTNRKGGMNVAGNVTSNKQNVVLTNTGEKAMAVNGTVKGTKITVTGKGADVVLGNKDTEQIALDASKKVSITVENGNLKNAGTDADLIKSDGDLFMNVTNGSIGEDVVAENGIGTDSRDLTKSVNVNVKGRVKAFTTDKDKSGDNYVINIATKGKDLNVDRIKADGKVILLTDKDAEGNTGSILNAATELDKYANVKGTSVQMISSGSIGTANNALHFRQTDANQKSNVMAVKDINLHARGEDYGEDVNFGTIKSKEGSVNVNLIRDGVIDNVISAGNINVESRKNDANLQIKNQSHNTSLIKDYFDKDLDDNL